jgi:glycerol-3-phosphate cytidylyltransferase
MKRVITYGTFDLLHYGHINLLRRAKALGDYLIVALSTDEFNWNAKQKKCYFSYEKRKQLLEAIRYVDLVIPEENWDRRRPTSRNSASTHLSWVMTGRVNSTFSRNNAKSFIWNALRKSAQPK